MDENEMIAHPEVVYENLEHLEQVDLATGAVYREQAQDVVASPEVSFNWREAISDRLNQVNRMLGLGTVSANDSY